MALKKRQMRGISAGDAVSKGRHWEFVERAHLWFGSKEGEQKNKSVRNLRGRTSFCKKTVGVVYKAISHYEGRTVSPQGAEMLHLTGPVFSKSKTAEPLSPACEGRKGND